ncbi:MAG TPA: glycosyltransferase, partial [Solirubrobacteraceae bacterium]|nr:glycosyltransferase [Solirubrobacteraceae bacterium]
MIDAPGGAAAPTAPVSVIVCGYTLERWDALIAGVRSLGVQTVRPREVVFVVDHNPELLARARERLPPELPEVRVVASRGRPGLSGARNTGVAVSHGEIVAFLDDDAVAEPEWIECLVAPYREPTVMATGGLCVPDWEAGRPWWFPEEFDWVVGCSNPGLPEQTAEVRNPTGAAMSIRRSALVRVGAFREDVGRVGVTPLGCEETELAIRIRQRITGALILHVPSAIVRHTVPASRGRVRYFLRRCYAEGLSKAEVVRSVGGGDGLGTERTYVSSVLRSGILAGLGRARRGDGRGIARAAMIV